LSADDAPSAVEDFSYLSQQVSGLRESIKYELPDYDRE
jgi:hypothetical protein